MKIKLKKGLDLNIAGAVTEVQPVKCDVKLFAVDPDDFPGLKPKLCVKEGDSVLTGTPLIFDKDYPQLKLVSPVAGTVKAVVRGERRKILRVEIEAGAEPTASVEYAVAPTKDAEAIYDFLAEAGLIAEMRQRPYDIVPRPGRTVRDIFVTAIDSAPLAVSPEAALAGRKDDLTAGAALLSKATKGKIYFSVRPGSTLPLIAKTERVEVEGPHPAGNAGVQAANIAPVNKGETVWTLSAVTLASIGALVNSRRRDCRALVAVCGPEIDRPCVADTFEGAAIAPLLAGRLAETGHSRRIISGNVFTGTKEAEDGFMHFPYTQLTVIAEGDDRTEFMGWASMAPSKQSVSPTFPGHFLRRVFSPDARLNGGRRSIIMSGEYDRMLPMDILSEYLIKAALNNDIDRMEKLGIYEVAPEDFGPAEYADTSKLPVQQIIRDGLDYMREAVE